MTFKLREILREASRKKLDEHAKKAYIFDKSGQRRTKNAKGNISLGYK